MLLHVVSVYVARIGTTVAPLAGSVPALRELERCSKGRGDSRGLLLFWEVLAAGLKGLRRPGRRSDAFTPKPPSGFWAFGPGKVDADVILARSWFV